MIPSQQHHFNALSGFVVPPYSARRKIAKMERRHYLATKQTRQTTKGNSCAERAILNRFTLETTPEKLPCQHGSKECGDCNGRSLICTRAHTKGAIGVPDGYLPEHGMPHCPTLSLSSLCVQAAAMQWILIRSGWSRGNADLWVPNTMLPALQYPGDHRSSKEVSRLLADSLG